MKRIARTLAMAIIGLLPYTNRGDRMHAWLQFVWYNRRRPRATQGDLNDFLYYLKTGNAIDQPLRVLVTDKENLKQHVAQRCGPRYCVPTLGLIDNVGQLEDYAFPEDCVIKPTHLSAQIFFKRVGENPDHRMLRRWLQSNYYPVFRERNYRPLAARIMVEPLLRFSENRELKIHCLRGEPVVISVIRDLKGNSSRSSYTSDWAPLGFAMSDRFQGQEERPDNLERILELTRALARDFLYIRVDLYLVDDEIYVGELTSVPASASIRFNPPSGRQTAARLFFGEQGFNLADFPELKP